MAGELMHTASKRKYGAWHTIRLGVHPQQSIITKREMSFVLFSPMFSPLHSSTDEEWYKKHHSSYSENMDNFRNTAIVSREEAMCTIMN